MFIGTIGIKHGVAKIVQSICLQYETIDIQVSLKHDRRDKTSEDEQSSCIQACLVFLVHNPYPSTSNHSVDGVVQLMT